MKIPVLLWIIVLLISACTPAAITTPTDSPATVTASSTVTAAPAETAAPLPSQAPTATDSPGVQPTTTPQNTVEVQIPEGWSAYANNFFGFGFAYPPGWFGPEEYVSEQTLRVEIGSDVVYPYGTGPEERTAYLKNAYFIVFQYTQNNQNDYWKGTYAALGAMADGEESSSMRDRVIRLRALQIGRFSGFEYISTLSETAQTEPVYSRNVILSDDQSNLLTILGTPGNVDFAGGDWRAVYQSIDAENEALFRQIIETLVID